jgi:hypothetical protein
MAGGMDDNTNLMENPLNHQLLLEKECGKMKE